LAQMFHNFHRPLRQWISRHFRTSSRQTFRFCRCRLLPLRFCLPWIPFSSSVSNLRPYQVFVPFSSFAIARVVSLRLVWRGRIFL